MFNRLYRGRYRLDGEGRIRREGLLAPKAERDAPKRRYAQHVEDFIETRRSVGCDEK